MPQNTSQKNLTIIGIDPKAEASLPKGLAPDWFDQILAQWPEADRPQPVFATMEQALSDDALIRNTRLAWLITEQRPGLYDVIGKLQDMQIPGFISRPSDQSPIGEPFQDGIVTAPTYAPAMVISGMLRSMWHQCEMLEQLHAEVRLLQAHQGGLCDQIGKMDEELRLAAQLQREFLPSSLPQVGSCEFRVLYRPAGYVSGDIYDVIRLDEHHIGFYIADAVGHGVPAALMTVFIKRSLPSKRLTPGVGRGYEIIPPNEALAHLNTDLTQTDTQKVHFATACYGIVDTRTLEMTFARAGHPFPMIMRANGSVDWLDSDGGLLGVFPEEEFELMHVQLNPGDRVLLYSDGFEVAFPEIEKDGSGEHRLVNSQNYTDEFKDLARGSLDEAVERFARKLDQQAGSLNQLDDMTAVLMGVSAPHDADDAALSFEGMSSLVGAARTSA